MQITVNGEARDIAAGSTVLALVQTLGLNPKTVVVQRNEDIIERTDFATVQLQDGDQIELVRFVGGG